MNLHEYQSKELLKKYNVPIQEGIACSTPGEAEEAYRQIKTQYGSNFALLGEISQIKRGVVSGCDAFYFPRDITAQALDQRLSDKEFKQLAKYKVSSTPTYAYPVLSGNRIFIKDGDSVTLWTVE